MKRYSVISAMEAGEFIDRVNMSIQTLGAEPIGGVSTQGALLLQAVLIDIPDASDDNEDEGEPDAKVENKEQVKAKKPSKATAAAKSK